MPTAVAPTAGDLSPAMLVQASKRRSKFGIDVELLDMDVFATTFPDRYFDAIVTTFLFCVLEASQQRPALQELARICKLGGQIRLLEYTYSKDAIKRLVMRLWASWVRWVFGAAFDRDTERFVLEAGLKLVETRFLYCRMAVTSDEAKIFAGLIRENAPTTRNDG